MYLSSQKISIIQFLAILTIAINYTKAEPAVEPKVGPPAPAQSLEIVPPPPLPPQVPYCGNSFPGTPNWNSCWERFNREMDAFHQRMHDYSISVNAIAERERAARLQAGSQEYFATQSHSTSTSNVFSNGYTIQASGIPLSTTVRDTVLEIFLNVGSVDSLKSRTDGNKLEMTMKTDGQSKWVKIQVPDGIKVGDLKVDRSPDTIVITCPTRIGGRESPPSNYYSTQSASSSTNTGVFNPRMGMEDPNNSPMAYGFGMPMASYYYGPDPSMHSPPLGMNHEVPNSAFGPIYPPGIPRLFPPMWFF